MQGLTVSAIEAAEREYLQARVAGLAALAGNPYGALLSEGEGVTTFVVGASSSPMLNRLYAEPQATPQHLVAQVQALAAYHPAIVITRAARQAPATIDWAGQTLVKLKGWTHLQLGCAIDDARAAPFEAQIQPVTGASVEAFARLHGDAFRTPPAARVVSQACFSSLLRNPRAALYLLYAQGQPVAGAALFFASNGVAYLGTAFTGKAARGQGYHAALLSHRIKQARAQGCHAISATALATSQSRRNLERSGLRASHTQTLYRLPEPG